MTERYIKLPYQLELPYDGKFEYCPDCNPTNPQKDFFRSMCPRHMREYEAAFDREKFNAAVEEVLEEGRKARMAMNYHGVRIDHGLRFR